MSTEQKSINNANLFSSSIKLESETDDDSSYEISVEFNRHHHKQEYQSSTSTHVPVSLSSAFKGKVEVTSKGRRKIFDGIRWQILCRRPDCRKQTNKKSLCITHYKEEYESNPRSFQVPSYQSSYIVANTPTRKENEDQNSTISTTNSTDNDELFSFLNTHRSMHEGKIKCLPNNRRFLFKNSKWQLLCKYDRTCKSIVPTDSFCAKHYELIQQRKRNASKLSNHHRSTFPAKRLKMNNDFLIPSSSSVTEQFNINSDENSYTLTTYTSRVPDHQAVQSTTRHRTCASPISEHQVDQSVQTDLTIPLCCFIHSDDHVVYSVCQAHKSTSSSLSCHPKSEPQSFESNSST